MAEGNGEDLERRLDRLEAENRELKQRVEEMAPSKVSRRSVLGALGVGGLALASGSAAAAGPTPGEEGTVGTGNIDWDVQDLTATTVNTEQILGSVAGGDTITNLAGTNLSIDSEGNLNASGSGGSGTGKDLSEDSGSVTLSDGESFVIARYASGSHPTTTLDVYTAGVSNSSFSVPSGLELRVYDSSGGTTLYSATSTFAKGSPLSSLSVGSKDIRIEIVNNSGSTLTASGFISATYV